MPITVTYLYSACVRIDTPDVRVLCDPWFTPGAYDGSWFQFPRLESPIERIGEVDLIYISHIHPDHYDPKFLAQYLSVHPRARLIIADFRHNHLLRKMQRDHFSVEVVSSASFGSTQVNIRPNESELEDPSDVDSALVVRHGGHNVVNMNDNPFNPRQLEEIARLCPRPDIALLGYTGAGPYPQTYYDDPVKLRHLASEKKRDFFERYRKMRQALGPRLAIPFAGKYLLGGRLAALNEHRGVADAVEVLQFDPHAVVLDDGGDASVDTRTLEPTRVRSEPYSQAEITRAIEDIKTEPLHCETYFRDLSPEAVPWRSLFRKAYANAIRMSTCHEDHYFCLQSPDGWIVMNANANRPKLEPVTSVHGFEPRSEVSLDYRQLFGLLTGVFHWNNAEIGSHLRVRRLPDQFNRAAQRFLNFLHV